MDASDLSRMLSSTHYSPADLEQVNDLCRNYPMFSLARMLKVRIAEALGRDKEADLKLAAVYAADRGKLFQLVTEATPPPPVEEEISAAEPEGIRFSDEPNMEADIIIEQHAPYAGPQTDDTLLELDEEENISSETLIEAVVKDEADLEDPNPEEETPAIDKVEPEEEADEEEANQEEPASKGETKHFSNRLIQSFIKDSPGPIRADQKIGIRGDVSLASIREHDGFITDTLAKIYVKQGLYAKAIYAYEKLSLKYPEKSAYFAAQIEKIRNINHS